jgi:hypothetical protein
MRVLLVEPQYRRRRPLKGGKPDSKLDDSVLWYPPLGLMKLSRFHKDRGDEVRFVSGCDRRVFHEPDLFSPAHLWDRVYITTLFTYHFDRIVKTIRFYLDAVGGTAGKIFVGGVMASLMPDAIFKETGIYPVLGTLGSPEALRLPGNTNIDMLPLDYELLDPTLYATNDTYYAYTTRGCTNHCPWCGVPILEPEFIPYIDVKPMIRAMRDLYGDKANLKLMDNNVLASPELKRIVQDLLELGYGRGEHTQTHPKRQRVVDFNQGLDAKLLNQRTMRLLARLNIRPMRIAFDRLREKAEYVRALELANRYGVDEFSNYMLYNYNDTPRDLYERLCVNIRLNEKWLAETPDRVSGKVYSYPMRYAPIDDADHGAHKHRERIADEDAGKRDWLRRPVWTRRFTRNIEIMKGAAHGAISPTPTLAWRTVGATFDEFLANLYMPEELLRNRNCHERRVYEHEPERKPGTGKVEEFRGFVLALLEEGGERFRRFHNAVCANSAQAVRASLKEIRDPEIRRWLKWYTKRR